jgi:hypothetical protein
VALLNLLLASLLIALEEFGAGSFALASLPGALHFLFFLALALLCFACSRALARVLSSAGEERQRSADAIAHSVVLALLLLYFYEPVKRAPGVVGEWIGSLPASWALFILAFGASCWVLRRIPRRATTRVLQAALAGALAVSAAEIALRAAAGEQTATPSPSSQQPAVYYIVLDGMSGLPAFPGFVPGAPALRERIRSDYRSAGFDIYERAYSNHLWTDRALYSILDNEIHEAPATQYRGRIGIPRTRLMDAFLAHGLRARIHQSSFLDFCTALAEDNPECSVYPARHLGTSHPSSVELRTLIAGLASRLGERRSWGNRRRLFGVVNSLDAFDRMIAEVGQQDAGRFVFAHILLPHEPFVLDGACQINGDEVERNATRTSYVEIGRRDALRRWRAYLGQVACVHSRVMRLIAALRRAGRYDETTLIVHSDHGSRISLAGPYGPTKVEMSPRLFLDFYSTLFVVKPGSFPLAPASSAGIERWAAISEILSDRMGWDPPDGIDTVRSHWTSVQHPIPLAAIDAMMARQSR